MNKPRGESSTQETQSERFKQAARELVCDEDEAHFEEKLRKVARHRPPVESPPASKKPKTNKPAK